MALRFRAAGMWGVRVKDLYDSKRNTSINIQKNPVNLPFIQDIMFNIFSFTPTITEVIQ